MRMITAALAATALALLPAQASASTSNTGSEPTKPRLDAAQTGEALAPPTPSSQPAAAETKKPLADPAVQTGASVVTKPGQSAQADFNERDASAHS
jgi:hypothetical protein